MHDFTPSPSLLGSTAGLTPRRSPLQFGSLPLRSRYLLAPLAGYTNLSFRLAVREVGGLGLATTDLVNARAMLLFSRKTMELLQTCSEDRPVAVQIYGSDAEDMKKAAQWLESYGVSSIDINMGCPVHKVTRGGGGSALMCDAGGTVNLVRTVVEAVRLPVTVKMRLGWDDDSLSAPFFARVREGWRRGRHHPRPHPRPGLRRPRQPRRHPRRRRGRRAHPRHRQRRCAHHRRRRTHAEMHRLHGDRHRPRGAAQSVVLRAAARWEESGDPGPPATYAQRLHFMNRHFHLLVGHRGERFACLSFRKVANWYCRVLRPGRDVQQRLMMIESAAVFDAIVEEIKEILAGRPLSPLPLGERREGDADLSIRVPGGPVERW